MQLIIIYIDVSKLIDTCIFWYDVSKDFHVIKYQKASLIVHTLPMQQNDYTTRDIKDKQTLYMYVYNSNTAVSTCFMSLHYHNLHVFTVTFLDILIFLRGNAVSCGTFYSVVWQSNKIHTKWYFTKAMNETTSWQVIRRIIIMIIVIIPHMCEITHCYTS